MAIESRWFRQNADWLLTDWLDDLGYPFKLIWDPVLCYVKSNGTNRGQCRSITPRQFGRIYDIPEEHVQILFDAAIAAGAMTDDGKLITICKWVDYQTPDAERKRKDKTGKPDSFPENPENSVKSEEVPGETGAEVFPENPPISGKTDDFPDSCHATKTLTLTETKTETESTEIRRLVGGSGVAENPGTAKASALLLPEGGRSDPKQPPVRMMPEEDFEAKRQRLRDQVTASKAGGPP